MVGGGQRGGGGSGGESGQTAKTDKCWKSARWKSGPRCRLARPEISKRTTYNAVARRECGRELPGRHQQRKIPRDDLSHDAQRLLDTKRERVAVELRGGALLSSDHSGEVPVEE